MAKIISRSSMCTCVRTKRKKEICASERKRNGRKIKTGPSREWIFIIKAAFLDEARISKCMCMCMCVCVCVAAMDENRKRGRKELALRSKLAVDIATSRHHLKVRSIRSVIAGSRILELWTCSAHVVNYTNYCHLDQT